MSDEMTNNGNSEETSALFVSSQKKKQAEEEARKKAEAEQAKRDAAEAEVRRMEAEVEERKRKAEEEKRALEEAAAQAEAEKANVAEKIKSSVHAEEIASKVKEKTGGKSKLPVIIGACAAAVVVVILIAVFAGKGKKSAIDFDALEFNAEYATQEENNAVTFSYPDSLYTGFTVMDDVGEGNVGLVSEPVKKSKAPEMSIMVSEPLVEKATLGITPAKDIQNALTEIAKEAVAAGGAKVTEEEIADIAADTPGQYYYKCVGTTGDGNAFALSSWLIPNSSGNYAGIVEILTDSGSDPTNVVKLRDAFDQKNGTNALKIPGANPPTAVETDGMLEIDEIHLGILVPKGRFEKVEIADGVTAWSDENGALYLVAHTGVDYDFETAREYLDTVTPAMKEFSESAVGLKSMPGFDSRMLLSEDDSQALKYRAEYKDIFGGVTYWEGDYVAMWRDVRTNEYCFHNIILMAPFCNQDIYKQMFDKAIDRLQDI